MRSSQQHSEAQLGQTLNQLCWDKEKREDSRDVSAAEIKGSGRG